MTELFARAFAWAVGIALIYIASFLFGGFCGLIFEAWWKGYSLTRVLTF